MQSQNISKMGNTCSQCIALIYKLTLGELNMNVVFHMTLS